MRVKKNEIIKVFEALGFKTAATWDTAKLEKKLQAIPALAKDADVDEGPVKDLIDEIILNAADGKIEIEDVPVKTATAVEAPAQPDPTVRKIKVPVDLKKERQSTAPVVVKSKMKKADKEKAATPAPKAAKKAAGEPGRKGVGVIAYMIELLRKGPITKDKILEKLIAKFPDRDPNGMKASVNVQVPSCIRTRKGLDVIRTEKGYLIET